MAFKLKRKIYNFYKYVVLNLYIKPNNMFTLYKNKKLYKAESYYPEFIAKPSWENYLIQLGEILKFGFPNEFYFMYGWDVKDKKERNEYLHFKEFWERAMFLNQKDLYNSSIGLLRNKLYFDIFARQIGIDTPRIIGYFSQNKLFSLDDSFSEISFEELVQQGDRELFCKEMSGECGKGIFKLLILNGEYYYKKERISISQIKDLIKNSNYIFQEVVKQHSKMSELHPNSINTIRLITVRSLKDGGIYVMPSILRIGTNGSFVDNTSQGGVAVGFDLDTGMLNKYGFYKPQYGRKIDRHPNSGVIFSDFQIPFIDRVKDRAIFFHSMLKDIHSIGWDIAIGENGPIFIEGNDNWEINGPQVGNRGLRKEFEEYFFEENV